ncbi:polyprenyl synthetase family protein [Streptomyces globosus]|uniref:polyprenyl synthetase family protein n=1 Tax=Streptomyces TaxID=1883 RepID=UPI0021AEB214|nr:polyprenyl synthetase family protein [Streptomyces sp. WAC05292]
MAGMQAQAGGRRTAEGGAAGAPVTEADAAAAGAVEDALRAHVAERLAEAHATDPAFAEDVAGRVRDLVLRGGKRLRARLLWWGWRACGGPADGPGAERARDLAAALELLQVCAVVHDDVMDHSPVRRGGPSAHADFALHHTRSGLRGSADAYGTAAAILVGDLALAWADDLAAATALAVPEGPRIHREWRALRAEMAAGQYLDLRAAATGATGLGEAVRIARLKSALYTVERPLALGAALAGAPERTTSVLRSAGRCAGLAFQLRDDLLGVFGDPRDTGKPAEDLRAGKLTYLRALAVRLAARSGDTAALHALTAPAPAPGAQAGAAGARAADAREALERTGAREVVEARIARLVRTGERRLAELPSEPDAVAALAGLLAQAAGVDTAATTAGGRR